MANNVADWQRRAGLHGFARGADLANAIQRVCEEHGARVIVGGIRRHVGLPDEITLLIHVDEDS